MTEKNNEKKKNIGRVFFYFYILSDFSKNTFYAPKNIFYTHLLTPIYNLTSFFFFFFIWSTKVFSPLNLLSLKKKKKKETSEGGYLLLWFKYLSNFLFLAFVRRMIKKKS